MSKLFAIKCYSKFFYMTRAIHYSTYPRSPITTFVISLLSLTTFNFYKEHCLRECDSTECEAHSPKLSLISSKTLPEGELFS